MTPSPSPRSPFLRGWLPWTAGFIAFPVAGLAGSLVVGRVDGAAPAVLGGAIAGLIIGAGQTMASSRRLQAARWIPATGIGMSAGVFLGAALVGYRTLLADLALMGAVTGAVVGTCQALALPRDAASRWAWAAAGSALWALGWTMTTLAQIGVDQQFIVFGASGALVLAALSGVLLHRILPANRPTGVAPRRRSPQATPLSEAHNRSPE